METIKHAPGYVWRVVWHGSSRACSIVDAVLYLAGVVRPSLRLSPWCYVGILVLGMVWASLQIYGEQQREIELLSAQLGAERDLRPRLTLSVHANGYTSEHVAVQLPLHVPTRHEAEIDVDVAQAMSELLPGTGILGIAALSLLSAGARQQYERDLESYRAKLRKYQQAQCQWEALRCRSISLQFVVANIGRAPAHDVRVYVTLPQGLIACREQDFLDGKPVRPERPEFPQLFPGFTPGITLDGRLRAVMQELVNGGESRRNTVLELLSEGTQVSITVANLLHNQPEVVRDVIVLILPADCTEAVFRIPYQIHAAELAEPFGGRLSVAVSYQPQTVGH